FVVRRRASGWSGTLGNVARFTPAVAGLVAAAADDGCRAPAGAAAEDAFFGEARRAADADRRHRRCLRRPDLDGRGIDARRRAARQSSGRGARGSGTGTARAAGANRAGTVILRAKAGAAAGGETDAEDRPGASQKARQTSAP